MQCAVAALSNVKVDDLPSLEDRITELAAHITAATWQLLELIREFDERDGWCDPGLMSCAHWLNWKIGMNLGAAREKVRVAHAIKRLPHISEQFRLGQVSYSKVRAMTRVATPENETYLLMIATHGTASHVERLVRQYRWVKRIEALDQANMRHQMRELSWYYDDDDCVVLRGRFPPEQGAAIIKDFACPDGFMYFLNSQHIAFVRDSEGDFAWLDGDEMVRPVDQDAYVRVMIVEGNIVTDNRRQLGLMSGIVA